MLPLGERYSIVLKRRMAVAYHGCYMGPGGFDEDPAFGESWEEAGGP